MVHSSGTDLNVVDLELYDQIVDIITATKNVYLLIQVALMYEVDILPEE